MILTNTLRGNLDFSYYKNLFEYTISNHLQQIQLIPYECRGFGKTTILNEVCWVASAVYDKCIIIITNYPNVVHFGDYICKPQEFLEKYVRGRILDIKDTIIVLDDVNVYCDSVREILNFCESYNIAAIGFGTMDC